jgi:ribonucleoside-diphosphate reductase alpha chain
MPELIYLNDNIDGVINRILHDKELSNSGLTKEKVLKTLESFQGDEIACSVFYKKYALKDNDDKIIELTLDESKDRWANAIIGAETFEAKKDFDYFRELYDYMLPAGRQMYALGNEFVPKASYTNCYVLGIEDDSIEGIYNTAKDMAKTYSYGGGVGICIGNLRPKGAKVSNSAKYSTGAVSFMELFSNTTGVIGQAGRRAALMISIPINHPDVEDFIEIKHNNIDKVKHANISVKITDDFMNAVVEDKDFDLIFETKHEIIRKTIRAKELWNKIITSAHNSAEPGILFWTCAQDRSPSDIYESLRILTTNPCGEQLLQSGGACVLSSVILSNFVKNPFTNSSSFNFDLFLNMIKRGVRHLDNVINLNVGKHAVGIQDISACESRRIGLGITGLADTFAALGLAYDSDEAFKITEKIMKVKMEAEYNASIDLAIERGSFPLYDSSKHFERGFCKDLSEEIKERAKRFGLRNVAISTIAPSGSISIMAQCSSGIEPIFALKYKRYTQLGVDERKEFIIYHQALARYFNINNVKDVPDYWKASHQINYNYRIKLQGLLQKYVDASISSTINLPADVSVETVGQIYIDAWREGLKGITVYREGSREGILVTDEFAKKAGVPEMDSVTYRVKAEGGDKFYIIVSYKNKNIKDPYQVFVMNYKQSDQDTFVRIGNSLVKMLKTKGVSEERITKYSNRSKTSLEKLTRFLSLSMKTNCLAEAVEILNEHAFVGTLAMQLYDIFSKSIDAKKGLCKNPDCKSSNVRMEEGCMHCLDCGWSGCN